jgi:hypothetical protein
MSSQHLDVISTGSTYVLDLSLETTIRIGIEHGCLIANFVHSARRFKKLRLSVFVGDSIMIEKASVDHDSVYLTLGRFNSFVSGIDAIEENCSVVDG